MSTMVPSFTMMALLAIVSFQGASAFAPLQNAALPTFGIIAPSRMSVKPLGAVDSDWEGIDLVKLLGTAKVKKLAKKMRQARNNSIKAEAAEASLEERRAAHGGAATAVDQGPAVGKALKLIIAGAPASGKGTQCAFIKEKYGVVHLSTGDMLRAAVIAGTQVGKQAKEFMDSGMLVPDEVIIGIVSRVLIPLVLISNENIGIVFERLY